MADVSETYASYIEQLGKTLTEQMERAQESQTQLLASLREGMGAVLPALPTPDWMGPILSMFPTPESVAKANFALMSRLLEAQKAYALGMLEAMSPEPASEEPPVAVEKAA